MPYCCEELAGKDLVNGVHLSGIGGVGMTALAEMLLDLNIEVTGSDTTLSKNVIRLKERGVTIYPFHSRENIRNKLVCRTRAVKDDNEEIRYATKAVYRSTLLSFLAKGKKQLVVTGAHGKTSVSALLAHCMLDCGFDVSFAVGGFSPSLGRYGKISDGDYFVLEGDESDGSHLKTDPFGGIITSCDVDHLAFWGNGKDLQNSYSEFAEGVTMPSHFIYNGDDEWLSSRKINGISFGTSSACDYFPENIHLECDKSTFSIRGKKISLPMFGAFNVQNAVAVYVLLQSLGVSHAMIAKAFASFKGISRRMEYLGKNIYSDYAHHPEEVKAVLKSLSEISEEMVVIFEPHRLSRFTDELENFINVFSKVIITDVFEASEGLLVDGRLLIDRFCKETESIYIPLDKIADYLKREKRKVLALGAGSLDSALRAYVGS